MYNNALDIKEIAILLCFEVVCFKKTVYLHIVGYHFIEYHTKELLTKIPIADEEVVKLV